MMMLTITGMVIFTVSAILTALSFLIAEKIYWDREKTSPFECGFEPMSSNRIPFSLRFFMVAVIFLVFDVEIVLLLPLSSLWELSLSSFWSFIYLSFLVILMAGTLYEWTYGALYWKS